MILQALPSSRPQEKSEQSIESERADVMEVFLIMLAVIAGVGVAVFLFVIEPRRKIYDYDPHDPRQ